MIKMVFCVRKRSDISAQEFYDYWLNQHGPLVKSLREPLGIKRYVQSHTGWNEAGEQVVGERGMLKGYDGLAELWWDNVETVMKTSQSEAGRAANIALVKDEARFIDLAASTIFFTEEHVIFED
jgi:uncharacterized protein (TIGR02118 family)